MAIGRTFKEALQKAIRALEIDRWGFEEKFKKSNKKMLKERLAVPNAERLWLIADALRAGVSVAEIYREMKTRYIYKICTSRNLPLRSSPL